MVDISQNTKGLQKFRAVATRSPRHPSIAPPDKTQFFKTHGIRKGKDGARDENEVEGGISVGVYLEVNLLAENRVLILLRSLSRGAPRLALVDVKRCNRRVTNPPHMDSLVEVLVREMPRGAQTNGRDGDLVGISSKAL